MATECTSNACDQGRKPCPTKQACELQIDFAEPEPMSFSFIKWAIVGFTAVAAVSFIAGCVAGYN